MENNAARKEFMDVCKGLVMNCECNILILEVFGEYRVYLAREVRLKTRECRYSEVRGAQDITTILNNVGKNFVYGMTEQRLMECCQSVCKEDFKFGTDNYLWLTKVTLNKG